MRAVLTYHSLDGSGSPVSMQPGLFREQIDWLASGDLPVVSLPRLLELPPDAHAVALTFDDGFRNFATRAWPLLREHGLAVTLFVVTGHAGGRNDWSASGEEARRAPLPLLGWDELERLAAEGVELGSHTVTHPDLSQLGPDATHRELAESADRIEAETGRRPRCFAYPYGRADRAAERYAGEQYEVACVMGHREIRPDDSAVRVPRLEARYFRRRHLARWGTPRFRARLRARSAVRSIRRMLTGSTV